MGLGRNPDEFTISSATVVTAFWRPVSCRKSDCGLMPVCCLNLPGQEQAMDNRTSCDIHIGLNDFYYVSSRLYRHHFNFPYQIISYYDFSILQVAK